MSNLEDSIKQLYDAFKDIPKPKEIEFCPCCHSKEEFERLLSKNLKDISADEMSSYASGAITTIGSVTDFLYFLPRIIHIAVTDETWWPDPEITASKIHSSGIQNFSDSQRNALENCLTAAFHESIDTNQNIMTGSWLCTVDLIGFDVRPHLSYLGRSTNAVLSYFDDNPKVYSHRKLSSAYWKLPSVGYDAVIEWFYSQFIRDIISDAYGYVMD